MSTSAAKRYHHGDLPRALVETARTLVEETGPANLTLRAVAARVGVSPAAPYRHFANLEALLAAVAAEGFDELADVVESADRSDPLAALHAVLTEYARFALRSPQLYRLMFGSIGPGRPEHAELVAAQDRLEAVAAQALRLAAAAGAIADQDLDDVLLALRSLMHGVVMWALDAGLPTDQALAGVAGVLAVMDRGLLPRSRDRERSGVAHAVVGERRSPARGRRPRSASGVMSANDWPRRRASPTSPPRPVVGEGQGDLAAVGQQHPVGLERLQQDPLRLGERRTRRTTALSRNRTP